ncbi:MULTISPECIES: hypothetical protein [Bacillus cereus group]|uniref:hypothetical protein n=1 Tax=Bacillus cereus group TaxID=86661 RepID=UPI000BECDF23|nr:MULTISPECIES: hypothetical protein [Bacillus cereus group]MBJ8074367.1 hypothetical protein [Bacillus cereus group sp. N12]MDF9451733.1 hypothetical protein [Bacillus toyonensis]MDG1562023.1 hypothetical protein [Bacillus toyonensis]PDY94926.1 hypothetical protein CON67_02610 [Bacillus toyonensis]PEO55595.1 hypothetical protein CN567_29895 [Bacillus toyonensis]
MNDKYDCLHDLVLPGDFSFADKLHNCMVACVHNMFHAESTEESNRWEEELERCMKEFKMLRDTKEEHEASMSYRVVIKDLRARGVSASLVTRRK